MGITVALVGPTSNPLKRIKLKHEHPIAFGVLRTSKGKKTRDVRILFDSGATGSFMSEEHARKLRVKNTSAQSGRQATVTFKLIKR